MRTPHGFGRWAPAALAVVVAMALATARAADAPKVADEAGKVLDSIKTFYAQVKSLSVEAASAMKIAAGGQEQTIDATANMKFTRPNLLRMDVMKGGTNIQLISNGKESVVFVPAQNQYLRSEAAETWADVIAESPLAATPTDPAYLLQLAMSADARASFLEGVAEVAYVGQEEVNGAKCHRLRFVVADAQGVDYDVWVDAGAAPLFHKSTLDFTRMLVANAAAMPTGATITSTTNFKNWNAAPELATADFEIVLPADAQDMSPPPHALLGKTAPDFDVEKLGGGRATLADYKGKAVVVLDFWATWCGPCVKALPTIATVTNQFKDRGVVFFAVNIQETPEEIETFLKNLAVAAPVPVALDTQGEVAKAYLAEGIPQTVIIGKDGVVQEVHVGLSGNLEKTLTRELEALVSGKPPQGG